MVAYARLSGADGMRVSRAAFSVMIKFSEFYQDFIFMVDEIDMMYEMSKDDPERELKMKEHLKSTMHYEQIQKRWESASKMRQWVNEKKKNLIERIKKEVETEYTKKKQEEKAKQLEEEKKAEEKKAEEKKVEDKKNEDNKVEEEVKSIEEVKPQEEIKESVEDKVETIDTAAKKEEEVPPPQDGNGLTEADKVAIDDIADQKFTVELQKIYDKIVEKAEFLIKL